MLVSELSNLREPKPKGLAREWTVSGLFSGIGGLELGMERVGMETVGLCETWEPARAVLSHRVGLAVEGDVASLTEVPDSDVLTAGFPCTDLSQAGRTAGIDGQASGLIGEVFRLLAMQQLPWVVVENVRNMLFLDKGRAMDVLVSGFEALGYRWAYRLVDSRFTGVPQRRQRVIFVAARDGDPGAVLFADDAGEPDPERYRSDLFGFYWTEGRTGLGWARDAVPPLKGGSTLGIPSPPAIWHPAGPRGRRVLIPRIEDGERLQGFPAGWTAAADQVSSRSGVRWKLLGNAVTVGVSEWVGRRLLEPGDPLGERRPLQPGDRWPSAACGRGGPGGHRWAVDVSEYPTDEPYQHLSSVIDLDAALPLSARATAGFLSRARASRLCFEPGFLEDLDDHRSSPAAA